MEKTQGPEFREVPHVAPPPTKEESGALHGRSVSPGQSFEESMGYSDIIQQAGAVEAPSLKSREVSQAGEEGDVPEDLRPFVGRSSHSQLGDVQAFLRRLQAQKKHSFKEVLSDFCSLKARLGASCRDAEIHAELLHVVSYIITEVYRCSGKRSPTIFDDLKIPQEDRYALAEEIASNSIFALFPNTWKFLELSESEKYRLALSLGEKCTKRELFECWKYFEFDEKTSSDLMIAIAEKNPTLVFEYGHNVPVLPEARQRIMEMIPFFRIEERLEELCSLPDFSFPMIREDLFEILQELHLLNKTIGIPPRLFMEKNRLGDLLTKVVDCSGDHEVVELVRMLNQTYFSGTNCCLYGILEALTAEHRPERKIDHPFARHISKYLQGVNPLISSETPQIVFTEEGVDRIVEKKLEKKKIVLYVPNVFPFERLKEELEKIYSSDEPKGLFLVNFGRKLSDHCSPLIIERIGDRLHILNTDSVGPSGRAQYHQMIVEVLATLSFPTSIYVLEQPRQHDENSCRVFAMRDVVEAAQIMATSPQGFFAFLAEHSELSPKMFGEVPVTQVVTVPAEMLKLTQSRKPPGTVRELSRPLPSHKGHSATLLERIEDHSFIGYKFVVEGDGFKNRTYRRMNLGAAMRAAKYFEELLEEVVSSGSP